MIMFICVKRDKSPQNFRQTTNRAHLCYIVIHKVVGKLFNCDYFFKVLILMDPVIAYMGGAQLIGC